MKLGPMKIRVCQSEELVNVELIGTRCFLLDLLYIFVVVAIVVSSL